MSTSPEQATEDLAAQYLLGAFMQDAAATMAACEGAGITPRDVQAADLQAALAAAWRLCERAEAVNSGTILVELGGTCPTIDLRYLAGLEMGPGSSGAPRWAREIKTAAASRRCIAAAQAVLARAQAGSTNDATWAELLQRLTAHTPAGTAATLPLQWARDLGEEPHVPPQLVEGLLQVGKVSTVMGAPGAAKTYFAADLAMAVASGREFLGHRVRQGCWVLYLAAEGASSFLGRLQAYTKHTGRVHGQLAVVAQSLNLLEPSADIDALAATARQVAAAAGGGDGLIVIDTAARVTPGADENSGQDMGRFIAALDRLSQATSAHVLVVHHTGKDTTRGARGHSSFKAALDTEILITLDEATKVRRVKVTKQRDLPSEGEEFAFKLLPVELGHDEWGNPITSCVVEPSDVGIGKPGPKSMTASQTAVLAYLAGREGGARRPHIVEALERQGIGRSATYKAVTELLLAELLMDVSGVIYSPKG